MAAHPLKLNADNTKVLWFGSRPVLHNLPQDGPPLLIGSATISASERARLLGTQVTHDLLLEQHVSAVSSYWFYHLRQLRCVRRCIDDDFAAALVHAFATSKIKFCCSFLIGSTMTVTSKLQRVLSAAARVVTSIRKYDRGLSQILYDRFHWLDVSECVRYRIAVSL
jgi:hypothetical protein